MIKKNLIVSAIFVFQNQSVFNTCSAQTLNWQWAKDAGDNSNDAGNSVAIDGNGNIYVTGSFASNSITFGSITLTNSTNSLNFFIVKYDGNGNALWAKSAGSGTHQGSKSIFADAKGNAYITGYFYGSDIVFGSDTLSHLGVHDIFIANYDAGGKAVWAKSAAGIASEEGNSIAVDGNGNVFITGYFQSDTVSFDTVTLARSNFTYDVFTAKYDSSGNILWAKGAGGVCPTNKYGEDEGYGIAVDGAGNSYVTGYFAKSTDCSSTYSISFGSFTLTNNGAANIFLVKYNANGNVLWAKSSGLGPSAGATAAKNVALDVNGNAYLTGYFQSSISFDTIVLGGGPKSNIFIAKYDMSGNAVWGKSAAGGSGEEGNSIAVDGSGNSISVTGFFKSSKIILGSDTLYNINAPFYSDMFVAQLGTGLTDVDEFHNFQFEFYPNPASGLVYISCSKPAEIFVTDIVGRKVPVSRKENILDFSFAPSGIYFLNVKTSEGNTVKKILKNKT